MIRDEFKEYMQSLGFTEEQIKTAYKKALTYHNSPDHSISEVICRDILQGKNDYLKEKN